ncbi:MAG: hypothetical protein II888_00290 [Clostridia bacterium]|nr:hypothetical protein [Clostridia bacterium]
MNFKEVPQKCERMVNLFSSRLAEKNVTAGQLQTIDNWYEHRDELFSMGQRYIALAKKLTTEQSAEKLRKMLMNALQKKGSSKHRRNEKVMAKRENAHGTNSRSQRHGANGVFEINIAAASRANADGQICLRAEIFDGGVHAADLDQRLRAWQEQAAKLKAGEITQEDYDRWRYHYPAFDDTSIRVPIPAEEPARSKRGRKPKNKD